MKIASFFKKLSKISDQWFQHDKIIILILFENESSLKKRKVEEKSFPFSLNLWVKTPMVIKKNKALKKI